MTRHYLCFEILYWRGIREGELLALTPEDIDISKKRYQLQKPFIILTEEITLQTRRPEKAKDKSACRISCAKRLKSILG